MTWWIIHLSADQNASGDQLRLQEAFESANMERQYPMDLAAFSRINTEDGSVDVFISPRLAQICSAFIAEYGGSKGEKPEFNTVKQISGNPRAPEYLEKNEDDDT